MSTTHAEKPPAVEAPAPEPPSEPTAAPALSRTLRRAGRKPARVLAVVSLAVAFGTTGLVVATAFQPESATPLQNATQDAFGATEELSDALRALRPGGSRNAARPLAGAAARAVEAAQRRVEALELPTSMTPLRSRVLETLRSDAAWVDAVGSTLANPRSPRRGDLAALAKKAATGMALIAGDLPAAEDVVGGTGRLLSATKPG
jgi:hypothetical protein